MMSRMEFKPTIILCTLVLQVTIGNCSLLDEFVDGNIKILDYLYTPLKVSRSVCYPSIGCLDITPEWYHVTSRPINLLPLSREHVGTKFYLFTRDRPNKTQELEAERQSSLKKSTFNSENPTFVVIHGFASSADTDWVLDIKQELLKYIDANVILVDWSKGAKPIGLPLYPVSAINTRLVALEIVYLIERLQENFGLDPKNVHIIGHSLGAHTAGYVGEQIKRLGRITGLDPAEPFFKNMPKVVRLDPSDAEFVDVIHTDGQTILHLGYGLMEPCGHVDFYPNGGKEQPGCQLAEIPLQLITVGQLEEDRSFVGCSHGRAALFFIESIARLNKATEQSCRFNGYECESYQKFLDGQCASCGKDGSECTEMGLNAIKTPGKSKLRKFYFTTNQEPSYCMYHYHVQIRLSDTSKAKDKLQGHLKISVYGSSENLKNIYDKPTVIEHGTTIQFILLSKYKLGVIKKVKISWDQISLTINPGAACLSLFGCNKALYIDVIKVAMLSNALRSGEARNIDYQKLCAGDNDKFIEIQTGSEETFDKDCA